MSAGRIVLDMPNPALDRNGVPMPKAQLFFYQGGTSILQSVFTDETLTVQAPNPLIADGAGRFPETWGDTLQPYDVKWTDRYGAVFYTFRNIYAFSGDTVDANGDGVNPVEFRTALGLGTAAVEDTGNTGHTIPFLDADNTWTGDQDHTGALTINEIDVGYLGIPPNPEDNDYTLVLTDAGKGLRHTSDSNHTWTIPIHTSVKFDVGTAIYLRNTGTGTVKLKRDTSGTGVSLRIAGNASDADVTLAAQGVATLVYEDNNDWVVVGVGLS